MVSSKFPFKLGAQSDVVQEPITAETLAISKLKLKKVGVYYVSAPTTSGNELLKRVETVLPALHGFTAIGYPGTKHKKGKATVYQCGNSIMFAPYHVSKELVDAVSQNDKFTKETKQIVKNMIGKHFPSREHFLRAFLINKASTGNSQKYINLNKIYQDAADPQDPELEALISLEMKINGYMGSIMPRLPKAKTSVTDRNNFESGEHIKYKYYPNIQSTYVQEIFREQLTYAYYMEDKSGVGKSVDIALKQKIPGSSASKVISSLVKHVLLPSNDNEFNANCNKSAATFLQEAENRSAAAQKRKPQLIAGASTISFGSEQRMHFWNPTRMSRRAKNNCFSAQITRSLADLRHKMASSQNDEAFQLVFGNGGYKS